jgi:membrane-associated phospholipid phosphatase
MKRSRNSSLLCFLLCAGTWYMPHAASAQTTEPSSPDSPTLTAQSLHMDDMHLDDSSQSESVSVALPDAPAPVTGEAEEAEVWPVQRETTWKSFLPNILRDQKDIWLSPAQLAKGHGWVPTLVMAAGTAGFIASDSHVMPYFRDHQSNLSDLNSTFNQWITMGEIAAVPVGLMVAGTARHDSYAKITALLAGRGYADTEVLEFAMKLVTRRERPSDVPAGQSFNHTFFKSQLVSLNGSSFPSGHAAGAFCVATVVSTRYKNHRWVPWAMYSLATAISLSRITTLGHFPSDVFVGAAMGYTVSRFEVLRPR